MIISTFFVSWFMLSNRKIQGLKGRVEMPRGQGLMMVVPQRVGLSSKTSLGSRGKRLVMIGCVTLSLKREEVLAHQ